MSVGRYWTNRILAHTQRDFWTEHKIHTDTNEIEQYYVIRRNHYYAGVLSAYVYVLGHLKYALQKGWIPIVDMENYPSFYQKRGKQGRDNIWEYFFEQPTSGLNLRDVYRSQNVILSYPGALEDMPTPDMPYFSDTKQLKEWRALSSKIPCKDHIASIADDVAVQMNLKYENTLGVLLRGTDYVALKPSGHPIQPTVEEAVKEIDLILEKSGCNRIYLATEDQSIVEKMRSRYSDQIVIPDFERFEAGSDKYLGYQKVDDPRRLGENYLASMMILSRCNSLFAGRTSGSVSLPLLGANYHTAIYWDRGNYA